MAGTATREVGTLDLITAVVLAGGFGTRLRGTVSDQPKAIAPIHDRPFLAYLLDQLAEIGIRSVVLCTGYLGEMVKRTIGESHGPMRVSYSQERNALGSS